MKIIKIFALLVLSLLVYASCDNSEAVVTGVEGGLVEIQSPSLNYIVGNPGPYSASVRIYGGAVKTTKVDVMKTFYTTVSDTAFNDTIIHIMEPVEKDSIVIDTIVTPRVVVSNTVPYTTIAADNMNNDNFKSFSFTFDDLIEGLSAEGETLPTSDGEYQIGDYWEFTYFSTTDDGRVVQQNKTTKVTVATRFAGKYKAIVGEYFRLGVPTYFTEDWPSETVIESVNATTYRVVEYFGAEAFSGNTYYFSINPATNRITYPATTPEGIAQSGNGQPFITCADNLADMGPVHCESSNYAVLDDVNGKDQLYMSFGYNTPGSGPRVFYQILEKIVE